MKFTKVFHNPTAGEGEHSKEKLLEIIRTAGYDCSYSSTKKEILEKRIPGHTDFITIAGGDGTVRKLATYLVDRKLIEKRYTIGLLPAGTANNIARTLGIKGSVKQIVERWKDQKIKKFDVGRVTGLDESHFFLEALGYGVFPRLMKDMKKREEKSDDPEKELNTALKMLLEIVDSYKPKFCKIRIDEKDYSGTYLMVEVMNIRSMGPNLNIAPNANPGDGKFDVILIAENQRKEFAEYVANRKKKGKEARFFCPAIKAKKIEITWEGGLMHIDDELITLEKSPIVGIDVLKDVLNFLI